MLDTDAHRRRWTRWLWATLPLALLYGLAWVLYWPTLGPATGIHQPLHYNQTYVWPVPWTLHQAAPGVPAPAPLGLHERDVVTQRFQVQVDNLAMVRVWLAGARGGEEVLVSLSDVAGGPPLYAARFRLEDQGQGKYYYLTFPAIREAAGRAYQLRLYALAGTAIARVGYVERVAGQLRLNEFPSPGDLDIGVYHRGRPGLWTLQAVGERLLPKVVRDRIQQYKPGAVKGATFGLLCALLGIGTGLVLGMTALPLSGRRGRASAALVALFALLAAGLLSARWDLRGMAALGRRVALSSTDGSAPPTVPAVRAGSSVRDLLPGLAFARREPEPRQIGTQLCEIDGQQRACATVPAVSEIAYGLHVPPDAQLLVGLALPAEAAEGLTFRVEVAGDTLAEHTLVPRATAAWQELTLDLRPYAGRTVQVELVTHPPGQAPKPVDVPTGMPAGGPLPVAGLWVAPRIVSDRTWLLDYPLAQPPEHAQIVRFGDQIELQGYDVESQRLQPGGALRVTLYWRALRPVQTEYTVFVHLVDATGEIRGQGDGQPLQGAYPTSSWPTGTVVRDQHVLSIAGDAQPGAYHVAVGLYELATLDRLAAYDAEGTPLPGQQAVLDQDVRLGTDGE